MVEASTEVLPLSIVIPAFEADTTIERAMDSAFGCGADEVIVIEDGSRGATESLVRDRGADYVWQPNSGAYAARLVGARAARNQFVVFLDADDEVIPSGVRRCFETIAGDETLVVSAGTVIGISARGEETEYPVRYDPVDTHSLLQRGFGPWPPGAAIVRRTAIESAQRLDPPTLETRFADDYQLLIRLSRVGRVSVIPEPTCRYRLAGGKSARSAQAAITAKEAIRAHYAEAWDIPIDRMSNAAIRSAGHARRARGMWAEGNRPAAVREIVRSLLADPLRALSAMKRAVTR